MKSPAGSLKAAADRLLAVFVPVTSVHALECDYIYRCNNGRRETRRCCEYPDGIIRCTNWTGIGRC